MAHRWRVTAALVLIVALGSGAAMAAVAGARRTWEAMPAFLDYSRPEDAVVFFAGDQAERELGSQLASLDMVAASSRGAFVPLEIEGRADGDVELIDAFVSIEQRGILGRPFLVAGRLPDAEVPKEVAVDESLAERRHLRPGDDIGVHIPDARGRGETVLLEVTAIVRHPYDLTVETGRPDELDEENLFLGPAFWDRYGDDLETEGITLAVRLAAGGQALDAFADAASRLGGDDIFVQAGAEDLQGVPAVRRATEVQAWVLVAFAGLGTAAFLVIVGQALTRHVRSTADDYPVLRSLGMTRAQLVALAVLQALAIALAGSLLGATVAFASSPLAPFGLARRAEVNPGLRLDLVAVAGVAALIVVALVSWVGLSSSLATRLRRRRLDGASRPALGCARGRATLISPPAAIGLHLALSSGRGTRAVPLRTAAAGVGFGLGAMAASLTFSANLDRLLAEPALRGWNWDVAVGEITQPDQARQSEAMLAVNPDVAAFSAFTAGAFTVDGIEIPFAGVSTDHGVVSSPVMAGRHPAGSDEVALGAASLERLGKGLGDTVVLRFDDGSPVEARIVGQVLPPAVLDGSMDLGHGGVATLAGAQRIVGQRFELFADTYLVRFASGLRQAEAIERLEENFGSTVLRPTSTDDLENLRRIQGFPQALAMLIGLLGLATLAHALVTSVRRRRRDLAVLKALGFTRRQVRKSVAWQATTLASIALVGGLPLGVAAGRWTWAELVSRLGITSPTLVPLAALLTLALAVLGLANLVAAWPARLAAGTKPAQVLRSA